jgi:hypothetical protein
MIDLKMLRVQRAEPIVDRFEFEKLAADLLPNKEESPA